MDLESVTERFFVDVTAALAGMDDLIAKAADFAAAFDDMTTVVEDDVALIVAGMGRASTSTRDLRDAFGDAGRAAATMGTGFAGANGAISSMTRRLGNLDDRVSTVYRGLLILDMELDRKAKAFAGAAGGAALLSAAMALLAAASVSSATTTAAASKRADGGMRLWMGGIRLGGQALHWLVMGTLEIAATAIPALVALVAASAGMAPTFGLIKDRMQSLVIASGGMHQALLNSVGPLHQLGLGFGVLSAHMAPDAYIIFGAAINSLAGHFGMFSGMAQRAGNVLAAFATKLGAEFAPGGSMSNQVTGFFKGAVKYMTQWGQVIGNTAHAFFDAISKMWGVAQVLLDVLVALSRAFLAIASNPVGAVLIGIAAGMSAVYRYGKLLVAIWTWLGGAAAVTAVKTLAAEMIVAAAATGTWAATLTVLKANLMLLVTSPVGIAIGVITAGLALWWLATRRTSDATTQLISKVQATPPTVANLTNGINQLVGAFQMVPAISAQVTRFGTSTGGAMRALTPDAAALTKAITQMAQELVNLEIGLAQTGLRTGAVGAGMNAMAIQTALADAKVAQLNQNLDAYISLLTGGTGAWAAFTTSLANIGTVAGTTANNLGTATGTMNLNARQFSVALSDIGARGASAWTNFDQVLGSTMPQMMDWFRQAATLGAATGTTVSKVALDMAARMAVFAGSNVHAQASIMGFLAAQGLTFPSWAKMLTAAGTASAAQADLTKRVMGTTDALANLSQMAKNTANALNSQVSTSIANAALQSSGFNAALTKLQTDMANHAPAAAIRADVTAVNATLQAAQNQATKTAQAIVNGSATATAAVQGAAAKQAAAWAAARVAAQAYQQFLLSMHGVNIVNTSSWISAPGGAGPHMKLAAGTDSARPGLAVVGEKGPELMLMKGGEQVIPAHPTAAILKLAGAVHGIPGYQAGTGQSSAQLMSQLTKELSVLAQRILAASSVSGISQYVHNLLSTIRQLGAIGAIPRGQASQMATLIGADNKRLATLFTERARILGQIRAADQYAASVTTAAAGTASLSTIMSGAGAGPVSSSFLLASMRIDLAGIRRFAADITKLEHLGLDRALLNQIIQMGPVQGDQVAQALITGPLSNIRALNVTESQVTSASTNLGRSAANMMFDAGKNAGRGFLSGLKGEEHQIEALMRHIAETLVRTLKKELGIHSPSSVTRDIGRNVIDGMVAGVGDRTPALGSALRTAAGHVPSALGSAAGIGGGGGDLVICNHIMVPLPSARQQWQEVQVQTLKVDRRNGRNNLSRTRGRGR